MDGDVLSLERVDDLISADARARLEACQNAYRAAEPFPHIVIDNFFKTEIAEAVAAAFPEREEMPMQFREAMSLKAQLSAIDEKWPRLSPLFRGLQSADFRRLMSRTTGIPDLLNDPILAGGGLHLSPNKGFVDLHVDANFHPRDKTLHRRVNIIIYMSKDWKPEWGGALELWSDHDRKPGELVTSVLPVFNRAVIFDTTGRSWHAVAPIHCPDGYARRSIALYYYTHTRPKEEIDPDRSVIWMNKNVWWKKALYPALNMSVSMLRPYAGVLRRMFGRSNTFDADRLHRHNEGS